MVFIVKPKQPTTEIWQNHKRFFWEKKKCMNFLLHTLNLLKSLATSAINMTCLSLFQFELFHLHENVCLCSRYKSLSLARLQLKFSKCGTLGVPETSAGRLWGQNYFHNNTRILFAFFNVDIGVDGAKVIMGKTAGAWLQIKAVVPNYTSHQRIFYHHTLAEGKNKSISLKNVLWGSSKNE